MSRERWWISVAFMALLTVGIALAPSPAEAQTRAYVTNFRDDDVSVIDTATNTVVATIPIPVGPIGFAGPAGVAISADGIRGYVANRIGGTVAVIDTGVDAVIDTVPSVGTGPLGVAVTPNGARVYVTNQFGRDVAVINTATNSVIRRISMQPGTTPGLVAVTPDGTRAYTAVLFGFVPGAGPGVVRVINTATNSVIDNVATDRPFGVAITPEGTRAYVTNTFNDTVSVVNTATNAVVATIPVTPLGDSPFAVAISPDGTRAYVTNQNSNNVSVIDTATNFVLTTIPVGSFPQGIALTSDGSRAYVVNNGSDNVSVIDTATNTVVGTILVGDSPLFVAITPVTEVAFDAFVAEVDVDVEDGEFEVKGTFTLGASSDGIDPLTQDVSIQLGPFWATIPAGFFELTKSGKFGEFEFEEAIDELDLKVRIRPLGGDTFRLEAEGERANLAGTVNPVEVVLTIGDDTGTISVVAELED